MPAKMQSVEGSPPRGTDGNLNASPLRASARRKSARSSSNMVLGSVLVMILLGGFALVLPHLGPKNAATAPPAQSRDERSGRVGTVTLSREGDHCRRMELDNNTGRMVEMDRVRCASEGPASPEDAVREKYSGGRIDAIRKSFSGR